jgi:hypothetical protein
MKIYSNEEYRKEVDRRNSFFEAMIIFMVITLVGPRIPGMYHRWQYEKAVEKNRIEYMQKGGAATDTFLIKSHVVDSLRAIEWKKNHFKKQGDE